MILISTHLKYITPVELDQNAALRSADPCLPWSAIPKPGQYRHTLIMSHQSRLIKSELILSSNVT